MTVTLPPDCAAKFRAERLLGSGGFGAVYLATQLALDRPAAVKVLIAATASDREAIARFKEEARITAALSHPALVKVLDFGWDAGQPWIAYEYVPGRSLRDRLTGGPLAVGVAVAATAQVLGGLDAAHAAGVLHRDVKPDNVLEHDGHFKLTDFGIAKWSSDTAIKTATGVLLGSPAYLSPEQIRGDPASPRSDVYAAGVMLHELVCGRVPFESEQLHVVFERHLKSPVPPTGLDAPQLEAVIARALAKDPADRYASAGAMAEALGRVGEGPAPAPPPSRPSRHTDRTVRLGERTKSVDAGAPAPPPAARSATRALAFVASALLLSGAAWLAVPRTPRVDPPSPPPTPAVSAPPAVRASVAAFSAYPTIMRPLDDALWIGIEGPPDRAVTLAVRGAGKPVEVPAGHREPVLIEGLAPSREYELELTSGGAPLPPGTIRFRTRRVRSKPPTVNTDLWDEMLAEVGRELEVSHDPRVAALAAEGVTKAANLLSAALHIILPAAARLRHPGLLSALRRPAREGTNRGAMVDTAYFALVGGDARLAMELVEHPENMVTFAEPGRIMYLMARLGKLSLPTLRGHLDRWGPGDCAAAARALLLLGGAGERPVFEKLLGSTTPELRRVGVVGFVESGALAAEAAALMDRPLLKTERFLIARCLVDRGTEDARGALFARAVRHLDDSGVIWEVARAAALTPERQPGIEAALASAAASGATTDVRVAAAAGLGLGREDASLAALRALVAEKATPDAVADGAAWALARREDAAAVEALIARARGAGDRRGIAAWALGMLGGARARAALAEIRAGMPAPTKLELVRYALVCWALARLGDSQAKASLAKLPFARKEWPSHLHDSVDVPAASVRWLFPFVGYDVVRPVVGAGTALTVSATGCWLERVGTSWQSSAVMSTRWWGRAGNRSSPP